MSKAETQGTVSVMVASQDEAICSDRPSDDEAVASENYTPIQQTVTFGDKETKKTIVVKIAEDAIAEPDEVFFLNLQDAKGGAELGENIQANTND